MYDLKIVEQLGKGFPYGLIDRSGTQRAADYHEDRFVGCEMAQFQCGKLISPGKLLPDGRTGKYRFFRREGMQGLGEITAYLGTNRDTQLIGKTGRHVGFVDNTGDFQRRSSSYYRNSYKASLGKDNIRTDFLQDFPGFPITLSTRKGSVKFFKSK